MWIKIDNDTYAKEPEQDPVEVVSISALEEEINVLKSKVKTSPDSETLDFYLEHHPEQQNLKIQLEKKELLLKEILE